jgi:YidC/Oxa1 family membrane protein insertase
MFPGADKRNVIIAIGLVVVILIGWQFLLPTPEPPPAPTAEQVAEANKRIFADDVEVVLEADGTRSTAIIKSRDDALAGSPRILIEAPRLHGSIALRGARIDDIILKDYQETVEDGSPEITLFAPDETETPYFAQFGWTAADNTAGIAVPDGDTLWRTSSSKLTPTSPVTLTWDNGAGLVFERTISVDEEFGFAIAQTVRNQSGTAVSLYPYSLLRRYDPPEVGFYKPWGIFQDGALGRIGEQQLEADYDDMQDGDGFRAEGKSGWLGITSKYFLSALIPDQTRRVRGEARHIAPGAPHNDQYQVDYIDTEPTVIQQGSAQAVTTHLFAGAKEVGVLDAYEEKLGVERFDLAVDFGFVWFLAKPLFYAVDFFFSVAGNFGIAILLLTICVRIVLYPLANKAYASMSRMRKLQPQMLLLRERFGDDKQRLNQETMALYRREKANPLAGCLPIIVQIPVFFALYSVLFVTIEMRHAPFFWWINDLAAPDPAAILTALGYLPWDAPSFLLVGIWPIAFGITMFLQMKLNPQPVDPMQQKIMLALPFVFLFMFAQFPAGLVVYWTWNNVLSIGQQWLIMRRMGVTKEALNREAASLKALKEGKGKEREKAIAALDAKLANAQKESDRERAASGKKSLMERFIKSSDEAKDIAEERRAKNEAKLRDKKKQVQDKARNARSNIKKGRKKKSSKAPPAPEPASEPKASRRERRGESAARAAAAAADEAAFDSREGPADGKAKEESWSNKKPKNSGKKSKQNKNRKRR